jgi:hypothetical protein
MSAFGAITTVKQSSVISARGGLALGHRTGKKKIYQGMATIPGIHRKPEVFRIFKEKTQIRTTEA